MLIRNNDRDLDAWTPNERVLADLRAGNLRIGKKVKCWMDCLQLRETDITNLLKDGDVLFSESEPHADPKRYFVQGKDVQGKEFKAAVEKRDSMVSVVMIVAQDQGKCDCPS